MSLTLAIPATLVNRFRTSAAEKIERVESSWLGLVEGRAEAAEAELVRRHLHTLKGDARMVGFPEVSLVCHRLEDLFAVAEGRLFHVPETLNLMMTMGLRFVAMLVMNKPGATPAGVDLDGFIRELDSVLIEARESLGVSVESEPRVAAVVERGRPNRLTERARDRLCTAATKVFLEAARSTGSSHQRLHDAWTALSETVLEATAVPLDAITARHLRAAKELSHSLRKDVHVELDSRTGIRVSPEVAEAVDTALLHLVRNAIDHGIEPAADRLREHKTGAARLTITVSEVNDGGDDAEISVSDDGRGVDWARVARLAVQRGIMSEERAKDASTSELGELLFKQGFSTADVITDVSGRGVGLDAVKVHIEEAGGCVTLESVPGRGTLARMTFPRAKSRMTVHCLEVAGSPIRIVVPATWLLGAAETAGASAAEVGRDVLQALGLGVTSVALPSHGLRLERGKTSVWIYQGRYTGDALAERICATPPSELAEIVVVDSVECVLVRPEHLGSLHKWSV